MKRLPFNACDYRCERCLATAECAVFRQIQDRSLKRRLLGRDADDLDVVLDDIRESFRETEKMIKEKARELGIDIDELAGGVTAEDIREGRERTMEDSLYCRSHAFTMDTHRILKAAEAFTDGELKEYFDDIAWHHTVVTAKVFRALGWRTDEEDISDDAKNSAAVAMKSLTICIMAFDHLATRCPEIADECRRLSTAGREIKEEIKNRFKPGGTAS